MGGGVNLSIPPIGMCNSKCALSISPGRGKFKLLPSRKQLLQPYRKKDTQKLGRDHKTSESNWHHWPAALSLEFRATFSFNSRTQDFPSQISKCSSVRRSNPLSPWLQLVENFLTGTSCNRSRKWAQPVCVLNWLCNKGGQMLKIALYLQIKLFESRGDTPNGSIKIPQVSPVSLSNSQLCKAWSQKVVERLSKHNEDAIENVTKQKEGLDSSKQRLTVHVPGIHFGNFFPVLNGNNGLISW